MIPVTELKKGFSQNDAVYDSKEEIWFSWYLDELNAAGYIDFYVYQPEPFSLFPPVKYNWIKPLKTKKKTMTTSLLRAHSYQADFKVNWNVPPSRGVFFIDNGIKGNYPFISQYCNCRPISYIDVKPAHDFQNMTRLFQINQKWVYQRFGVYVQKVVPQELFKMTFTPERYLFTDKNLKPRKIDFKPIGIKEFINVTDRIAQKSDGHKA